ncbi:DUF192 domain-containing protein [Pseudaestuariivita rosea]|uniref:DUF192 domain-containing protein n=1 Tax=Pseudaestuariivita rosea TaxID=2763263 RepID=UPI001ABA1840|nr:DUF192 domain-containing protein [Pseudaestuariivita rosea]
MGSSFKKLKVFSVSVIWLCAWAFVANAACSAEHAQIRGAWGEARFSVEIADDPAERGRGLMNRETLPQFSGMLFVYDRPQPLSFWMENTLIPLDILFIRDDGTVHRIHYNATPMDRTPLPSDGPVQFVLEINGGMAQQMGIGLGSELRHPAIDQTIAVWPC